MLFSIISFLSFPSSDSNPDDGDNTTTEMIFFEVTRVYEVLRDQSLERTRIQKLRKSRALEKYTTLYSNSYTEPDSHHGIGDHRKRIVLGNPSLAASSSNNDHSDHGHGHVPDHHHQGKGSNNKSNKLVIAGSQFAAAGASIGSANGLVKSTDPSLQDFGITSRRSSSSASASSIGDDLRMNLNIDLKTSLFGGSETLTISQLQRCDACTCGWCDGSGFSPTTYYQNSRAIKANNKNLQQRRRIMGPNPTPASGDYFRTLRSPCPACHGTGFYNERQQTTERYSCLECKGHVLTTATKHLNVTIPVGITTGNKLRLVGEGDVGPYGGLPGDLYVSVKVKDHPSISKHRYGKDDLFSMQRVSYADVMEGATIQVPVIDGFNVTVELRSGMKPGEILRLKGYGIPKRQRNNAMISAHSMERGDHCIAIQFEVPNEVDKQLIGGNLYAKPSSEEGNEASPSGKESTATTLMIEDDEGTYKESLPGLPIGPLLLLTAGLHFLTQF